MFIFGCSNFRTTTVGDYEKSKLHRKAHKSLSARLKTSTEKIQSTAGKALKKLKAAERGRLTTLFRNVHSIAKNNRPLSDYVWLCELDKAKQIDIGSTYINDTAASEFIHCIAKTERQKTTKFVEDNPFFAFMMDGSTDISGG